MIMLQQAKAKHKREYDMLIAETATRATGGISSCICKNEYLCRHNKSARYVHTLTTYSIYTLLVLLLRAEQCKSVCAVVQ
jgi:hypothetical protein